MSKEDLAHAAAIEVAKGAPPGVVVISAQVQGWQGADIITALTIIYLLLQILWLLWRWRAASKNVAVPKESQG